MSEARFKSSVKKEIKGLFPGCDLIDVDPTWVRSFPDLLVLEGNRWAALEFKRSKNASRRPNQDFHIQRLNSKGGFAAYIYPENKDEVLNLLTEYLGGAK